MRWKERERKKLARSRLLSRLVAHLEGSTRDHIGAVRHVRERERERGELRHAARLVPANSVTCQSPDVRAAKRLRTRIIIRMRGNVER